MSFFSEYREVNALLQQKQPIVFYAESRHYFPYYERLITDILKSGKNICYITSDANDPLLKSAPVGMNVYHVKWLLGTLFSRLRADVMIMTMPDLGHFIFKRSKDVGCYIYIFHAAVSTHQQYTKSSFFNYDCIFCTGEYQEKEIRIAEELNSQKKKEVVQYGYPLLEEVKRKAALRKPGESFILVAPSWFDGCIFDSCIEELMEQLAKQPRKVILRSHPEYEKRKKKEFRKIKKLIEGSSKFELDTMSSVLDRLPLADMLITDRSGIAFEFAFGVGRPVLFIDTKPKETNPDWRELEIEPIENSLRNKLGIAIQPSSINNLQKVMSEMETMSLGFAQQMEAISKITFYNSEQNYKSGLDYILGKLIKG